MRVIKFLLATCLALFACIIVLGILTSEVENSAKAVLVTVVSAFGYGIFKRILALDMQEDIISEQLPATGDRGFAPPRGAFPEYLIEYADADGSITKREIYVVSVSGDGEMIEAWCFLRHEMRTFRSSRAAKTIHLRTGRRILNIGRHYMNR